jgi:hypothetical protein
LDSSFSTGAHAFREGAGGESRSRGARFKLIARVMKEQFELLQGAELIRVYGKEEGAVKAICQNCGSSLFGGDWPDGEQVSIRLGAFDDDPGIRPQFHTYVDSRAPWDEITDDLPQYREARSDS